MPTGKACSQAAHATLGAYLEAPKDKQDQFNSDGIGTKICLGVADLQAILEWRDWATHLDLPHALIEDTGANTYFKGIPTISALGIGPLTEDEARPLRTLKLLR